MRRSPGTALLGALGFAALLPLVWLLAVHVGPARWLDASILKGFSGLRGPRSEPLATVLAESCNPQPYAVLVGALVVAALLRRRPRTALAVLVVTGGANVTTQLLKDALASTRVSSLLDEIGQVPPHAWPSGHATASMALALCAVLVAPARLRPLVAALGAVFAVAVTFSFLVLEWHLPSDVVGGFAVASAWTLLAVAGLWWADARAPRHGARERPPSVGEALAPAGLAAACAALVVGAVLLARPQQVVDYAHDHTAFVAGASAIAVAALALAAGLSLLVRRAPRR